MSLPHLTCRNQGLEGDTHPSWALEGSWNLQSAKGERRWGEAGQGCSSSGQFVVFSDFYAEMGSPSQFCPPAAEKSPLGRGRHSLDDC